MKKKIFIALLFSTASLLTFPATAQQLRVKIGGKADFGRSNEPVAPIGAQNNTIYFQTNPSGGISDARANIALFDAESLNLQQNTKLTVPDNRATLQGFAFAKKTRWLFARTFDKATKIDAIKAYKLDIQGQTISKEYPMVEFKNGGGINSKIVYAHKYNGSKSGTLNFSQSKATVSTHVSQDSSKIAIIVDADGKDADLQRFIIKVFDSANMSLLWEQIVAMPYTEKNCIPQNTMVTNAGEVILIAKVFKDKKSEWDPKTKKAAYTCTNFFFDGKSDKAVETTWKIAGKFMGNFALRERPENGNIIVVSACSANKGSYLGDSDIYLGEATTDLYGFEVEAKTGALTKEFTYTINAQDIKHLSVNCVNKKTKKIEKEIAINNIYIKQDGSLLIDTDIDYEVQGGAMSMTQDYFYLDDIVFNFDTKQQLKWATAVPKKLNPTQTYSDLGAAFSIFKNDKIFIIYNDITKNLEQPIDAKIIQFSFSSKFILAAAQIDENGVLKRKEIASTQEFSFLIDKSKSIQFADDDLLITGTQPGFSGDTYKIVRIKAD
ncbi:MAG: hypothetical protein RI894_262 [Bacteroidota bacterium]